jgi:predicted metalloprotease with PDZ domain
VTRFFGLDDADPFSFLLVAVPGIGRDHDGVHLTRSIGLWFDAARPLDVDLQVVIAHELCHEVFGTRLRLVDDLGREATWFSEGFAVHFARRILLRERLISPEGFLSDVTRTLAAPDGPPDAYRRGALYAASLDAALRRGGKAVRSLDELVGDLLATARRERTSSLPMSAFRDAVVSALGPAAGDDFDRKVVRSEGPIELPEDAFGPCFHRITREETVREIGFDPEGLRGEMSVVRGLVKGSAAEKAGVKEGALVIRSKETRDEVELTVADGRKGKRIRYKPTGKRRTVGWEAQACRGG